MKNLVSNQTQVLKNIAGFVDKISTSAGLQSRLSYARAWYAVQDSNGQWLFGPSKFVGYDGLSPDEYIKSTYSLDGRATEAQLSQWFVKVEANEALHGELSGQLTQLLARYGKVASAKTRFNVLIDTYDQKTSALVSQSGDELFKLLLAVAKTLPPEQLRKLKASLAN